jgi:hypothetical protein
VSKTKAMEVQGKFWIRITVIMNNRNHIMKHALGFRYLVCKIPDDLSEDKVESIRNYSSAVKSLQDLHTATHIHIPHSGSPPIQHLYFFIITKTTDIKNKK